MTVVVASDLAAAFDWIVDYLGLGLPRVRVKDCVSSADDDVSV